MNGLVEPPERFPTGAARQSLATRLNLRNDAYSQDWEYEIASLGNFDKWYAFYNNESLTDDEKFSLMMMIVQCVEDIAGVNATSSDIERMPEWQMVKGLLLSNPELHATTIWYWSLFGCDGADETFCISRPMRDVWVKVQSQLLGHSGSHPAYD